MRGQGQCAGGSKQREMVGRKLMTFISFNGLVDILSAIGSHQKIFGMCDGLNGNVHLRL